MFLNPNREFPRRPEIGSGPACLVNLVAYAGNLPELFGVAVN